MAKVFAFGYERIIEQGVISDQEWENIKRDEARKIDAEIKRKAPRLDEDPQVSWNYRRDWRTAPLPAHVKFGSDYDYYNYVVSDCFDLWNVFGRLVQRDYVAERKAHWERGASVPFYRDDAKALAVWQNGKVVTAGTHLEGPQVDVGPTADFSVFLEQWNYSKSKAKPIKIAWGIGVMHAIARQLAVDYAGIHTVFVMPIRPSNRSEVRAIPHRPEPIVTFPIIRILPRHYSRRRR